MSAHIQFIIKASSMVKKIIKKIYAKISKKMLQFFPILGYNKDRANLMHIR